MEFVSPKYLSEAFDVLDRRGAELKIAAGMTHILRFYSGFPDELGGRYKGVLHIGDLQSLEDCREESQRYLIGSTARIAALESDPYLARYAPSLTAAAQATSTPQIRNRRTIGGEVAWGSYHSPLIVTLMALNAKLRVRVRANEGQPGREETWELSEYYEGELERVAQSGRKLVSRAARTKQKDLLLKIIVPSESLHGRGVFSFFRALNPKISTENSGLVVAVSGVAQNGVIQSARMVTSGLWMQTLDARLPLEGVRMTDAFIFEKLYSFCERYGFEKFRRDEGPSAAQLGLTVFGLLKEGFQPLLP